MKRHLIGTVVLGFLAVVVVVGLFLASIVGAEEATKSQDKPQGKPQLLNCVEVVPYVGKAQRKERISSCGNQGFVLRHDDWVWETNVTGDRTVVGGTLTWEDDTTYRTRTDLRTQARDSTELNRLRLLAIPFVDALPLPLTAEERADLINALVYFQTEGALGGK